MKERRLYLAGAWVESTTQETIRSPYDGQALARVHLATPAHADEAVSAAAAAFPETRRLPSVERSRILLRLRDGVAARRAEIERLMVGESGKPVSQARMEVERGLVTLSLAAEEARRVGGKVIPLDLLPANANKLGITRRVPIGPVLGIPAFNFPFNLVAHKIAPALAAGNPAILKPAPQTPLTALLIAEIFDGVGAPPGMLSVLPCDNAVAERLVADERIAALTFTGSSRVGWRLKQVCGKKRVLLELGGNCGAIVDADADLDAAAARCAMAGFAYAGQVCVSLQRVFAHRSVYPAFTEKLAAAASRLKLGDPADEATHVGPMISDAAAQRAEELLRDALSGGARLVTGGRRDGRMFSPTLLADATPELRVCREEAFAPIVTITPFGDIEEAIRLVNATPYGLSASIFTGRIAHMLKAFDGIESGTVLINEGPMFRADNGPFGGVKDSGIGRESVRDSLEQMTDVKTMVLSC